MDDTRDPTPAQPRRDRLRLRWAAVALAAAALLGLSQLLWWWETWPVRQLLEAPVQQVPSGVRG